MKCRKLRRMISFLSINFITCVIADQPERSLLTNVITFKRVPRGIANSLNMQGLWRFTKKMGRKPCSLRQAQCIASRATLI